MPQKVKCAGFNGRGGEGGGERESEGEGDRKPGREGERGREGGMMATRTLIPTAVVTHREIRYELDCCWVSFLDSSFLVEIKLCFPRFAGGRCGNVSASIFLHGADSSAGSLGFVRMPMRC